MFLSIRPITQLFQTFRIIGVLLAVLLWLPGCSSLKLVYNNAPELSYWWLDSYFDFDAAQSLQLRAELTTLQAWHRTNELPGYLKTLEKLQRVALVNVTPAQTCLLYAELRSHAQTLIDRAEPIAAAMAPTLKPEQIEHLARQLDKRRQKWRDEWLEGTPAEQHARRVKQLADRADMLYGRLEEPQLAQLRAAMQASAFDADLTLRESLRRHQDVLQTLRPLPAGGFSAVQTRAQVHALFERILTAPDVNYRQYAEHLTQENCQTLATLHNSSTPAQRLKAIDTLKNYAAEVRALIAAGH